MPNEIPTVLGGWAFGSGGAFSALWGMLTWFRKRDAEEIARLQAQIGALEGVVAAMREAASVDDHYVDEVRQALFELQQKYTPVQVQNAVMQARLRDGVRVLTELKMLVPDDEKHVHQLLRELIAAFGADAGLGTG